MKTLGIAVIVITGLTGFGIAQAKEYNWGAISIDLAGTGTTPYYGIGGGDTKSEATSNAMGFCKDAGGKGCKTVATYEACGSVAVSRTKYGYGTGATKSIAQKAALEMCAEDGCKLAATDCN